MSFLRKGGRRAKIGVVVFSLMAFQALAVISAGVASAVGSCTYNPATQTINIVVDSGELRGLAVDGDGTTDTNLDAESPAGAILFDSDATGVFNYEGAALTATQCGSATISNTVSIVVLGTPSTAETFTLDDAAGGEFATTITWAIDLGSGAPDTFQILGSEDTDDTVVLTDSTFTLNGAGGPVLGAEFFNVSGSDGDDVIDGSALTAATQLTADGGADDDVISPGAGHVVTGGALPPFTFAAPFTGEVFTGGGGTDTISYAARTTSVVIINGPAGSAGHSANADCDVADIGDERDVLTDTFEVLQGGSGNDCLVGTAGPIDTYVPGDGDDTIVGQFGDIIDWSSSSAGMVIDVPNLTATGQGTDTWDNPTNFIGSPFDDTLITDGSAPGAAVSTFSGGAGVDTVDGSAEVVGITINLETLDPGTDDLENAIGGAGSDLLVGNDLRNNLEGNDGDDTLLGAAGNDTLTGGLGNDTFSGGTGADRISYASNTTSGINADLNLGFITSAESGDDGFVGPGIDVEIVQGSPFNDSITGGGGLVTINFLFTGGAGKDTLTGSGSNDTLKGGAGNDRLRGLEGGDTLKGGPGTRDRAWGGPGVDFCTGTEFERGCE